MPVYRITLLERDPEKLVKMTENININLGREAKKYYESRFSKKVLLFTWIWKDAVTLEETVHFEIDPRINVSTRIAQLYRRGTIKLIDRYVKGLSDHGPMRIVRLNDKGEEEKVVV